MNCTICNSENVKNAGEKNAFVIYKCKSCLTLFADKIEDSAQFFDYSDYYDDGNLTVPEFVLDSYRNTISGFETYRGNNRFLDVGCGAGTLLDIAKELNWDCTGVEVSKPAAEHLKKRGLNIFEGTLEDAAFPDNHFDVITCTEVIEHVTDPKGLLKEIARILSPNGILWMTTPHSTGLSARLLGAKWSVVAPPEHLNLFSTRSLKNCLNEVGFSNCRFTSNGFNPVEVIQSLRSSAPVENDISESKNAEPNIEKSAEQNFDRVQSSYKLNKWFVGGKHKQKVKNLINYVLGKTRSGDTLKVWARFE